jgi:carboxymethylenebutenolidase
MRRIGFVICGCLVAVLATLAAPPVNTQEVGLASGGETIVGYLALPESAGQHPAVVLIHESWGLNDWIKQQARKFADQGYVALAVDLYRRDVAYDPSLAWELMHNLPQDRALRDLKAGFDFLAARPDVNKDKIGSVGWNMGGGYSLQLAINEPRLAACVVNYGGMPSDHADIQKIKAPVLGIYGAEDRDIPVSDVRAFEDAMKAANKSLDLKIYPGAGHSFENPNNKLGYREGPAEDAWNRTLGFLDHNLK